MKPIVDWASVDLVVFDVDGTLYDQAPVRREMLISLLAHSLKSLSLRDLRVIRAYRHERERVGDERVEPFEPELLQRVATRCQLPPQSVADISAQWLQHRALPHLRDAVFPGIHQLFDRLRRSGRKIAVYSDYPGELKLRAMSLNADIVVSAHDADVAVLKPHPRGLSKVLAASQTEPARCLMIGDRIDRDAAAAESLGVRSLILQKHPYPGLLTFTSYFDDVFSGL